MQKLSEQKIIELIHAGQCFECESSDSGFSLKIESWAPSLCTALNSGHKLRGKLHPLCAASEELRLKSEAPYSDQLIQAMPITLIAQDSHLEYDLSRPLSNCIHNEINGKKLWHKRLPPKERGISVDKHRAFYRILDILISELERRFGALVIFDINAYPNDSGTANDASFKLLSEHINSERWPKAVDLCLQYLSRIELPNLPVNVAEQHVQASNYLSLHVSSRYENTLVLPLAIKKVFIDELSGEPYPLVMQALKQQMKDALVELSTWFARRFTSKRRARKTDMLADGIEPAIIKFDRALYQLAKKLDTLHYINPINIAAEKKQFFKKNANYQPDFHYRQLDIDPYRFREQLYRLPIDDLRDPTIQNLYRDVIESLSQKIAMLVRAGKPGFVYESLAYYGEPSLADEQNAGFLLHANQFDDSEQQRDIDCKILLDRFKQKALEWNMQCKTEISNKLVASAMVSNSRRAVIISKNIKVSELEANALLHHELGVHMATTLNALQQRLKVFSLGLPGNTLSQEGLAILNEYQSGNINLKRLQGLGLRVLAVKAMLKHGDFRHTWAYLVEEQRMAHDEAWTLAVRVHRGGGFTKDYLYLNGVSQALALHSQRDIRNLYVGKTGFAYLDVIDELVERQVVSAPTYYPEFLKQPSLNSAELNYLMRCIQPAPR
ncbi:flavohemoglobin expression-modulating QEGLA motif protein [Agaribacterium haliotis]|uniref:flavohemoglobin expression-modulating QEGLA motif protein n=1 Tax=Agaribacterium haliotis TaxID=2013869 RepID=UPI00130461B8|nr:flavohemoglobin expression-modulating QEGLA motif protein [Agaribacterium haliotis]